MAKKVRVRFAPSPTGGLHLGGVRTVLYNYLFARQHGGDFVLRIEDTDQSRYVPGAEDYIYECLKWCGLQPDESPQVGGPFAPYRQSERKSLYRQYAEFLVQEGKAYYAFDRPEELESMRERFKTAENPSPQYDHKVRQEMRNSCALTFEETDRLLADGVPHVIRIRMPENETVTFTDMIRGEVSFHTGLVDDKVLLKADGMPTYHLAVVVDDYLMKITHAFRGEEWLPSAPVHILLWKYLGWEAAMPQWAHLPLILKPDGNGKLSKRDGDRLGFPVFAMNWTTKKEDGSTELTKGFRELGFLPEAFINMLAMLGWNDGTDQELFTLDELVQKFAIDRVHKGGAKFDFEKAKWFNHEWIKKTDAGSLKGDVKRIFDENGISVADDAQLEKVITLVKERCTLLSDFVEQARFFFQTPQKWDVDAIKPKWNEAKQTFFGDVINYLQQQTNWNAADLEHGFKELATAKQIKAGEVLLPLRIMLVGGKFGPGVFDIATIIGKEETIVRIKKVLELL
ncbi:MULTISPECIES: glutamate--tRNA ligase [Niastella]|uniref:Glutamate--tRNA ligase n=1 Tax=Niastella soli TaxID=2821487 RepID=A0ABS3YMG5_9BACT|nr:glutamate--tRNA ligase [Niastella soli]MBO9199070.1 glutamate--tRNA ligase [Niastella soli]